MRLLARLAFHIVVAGCFVMAGLGTAVPAGEVWAPIVHPAGPL